MDSSSILEHLQPELLTPNTMKLNQISPALLPLLASMGNAQVGPSYTLKALGPVPFAGQPVNAHSGGFWIGQPSAAICGPGVPCVDPDTKILGTGDHLETAVPPGQALFVLPNGALSYTPPGAPNPPPNALFGPFKVLPSPDGGSFTFLGAGFSACPTPGGLQVFAINSPSGPFQLAEGCVPFDAAIAPPADPLVVDAYV
ncbi:hypothetical protein BDV59DRAFT_204777 [Aspergillus ambiguus]|uniref:putative IgE binding protein n=1 Tax=Aspergillus ambiguus TaxID=176160 RepID=UPI003CCD7F08